MSQILSHTGDWSDSTHYDGVVTLDPGVVNYPTIVGLELAYGDTTGMTIAVSGMSGYPSGGGPLAAGSRLFATGDGTHTVTYRITALTARTIVMGAYTAAAHIHWYTSGLYGPLSNISSATINDPGWQAGDRHYLAISATGRPGTQTSNPTVPSGWTYIDKSYVSIFRSEWNIECVYAADWAGESSITFSVPGGWYHGGYFWNSQWGYDYMVIRGATAHADSSTSAAYVSGPPIQSPMTSDGLVIGRYAKGGFSPSGWIFLAATGSFRTIFDRSTVGNPPLIVTSTYPPGHVVGYPSLVDVSYSGDIPAAGGWRVGDIRIGPDNGGW